MKEEANSNNANVDSGLKALEVPRFDRASEVVSQAVGDSIGLDQPLDPLQETVVVANSLLANLKMWDKWSDEEIYESIKSSMFILRLILPKEYKNKLAPLGPITIQSRSSIPHEPEQSPSHL